MSLIHLIKTKIEDLTGYYIHKRNDLPVGVSLKYDIEYKLKKIKIRTIFDVGANIGQTAVQCVKDFPEAKIYSFEPISKTFQTLVSNTEKYPSVICKNIAFGDQPGNVEINIFDDENSELNSLVSTNMNLNENSKKEIITVDTIDHFLAENKINEIDLLKIDTEGFEINVLNSAAQSFKENKVKLVFIEVGLDNEFNKRHQNIVDIQLYLTQRNFVFVGIYNIAYSLLPQKGHFANALYANSNYL
jgi:FkbM family methyltransferase